MEKQEAMARLEEILFQLQDLEEEASEIFEEHYPNLMDRAEAYEVFKFGSSSNPYNITLASMIFDIKQEEII